MPTDTTADTTTPLGITRTFLESLEANDLDTALDLVDDDLEYINVSLPTVHGRSGLDEAFRPLLGRFGFRVAFHHIGVDADDPEVVLTERTDALLLGPVHWQFWVYGRFEVRNGKITVWRDSFDWADVLWGLARGVVGAVIPGAARRWPEA